MRRPSEQRRKANGGIVESTQVLRDSISVPAAGFLMLNDQY